MEANEKAFFTNKKSRKKVTGSYAILRILAVTLKPRNLLKSTDLRLLCNILGRFMEIGGPYHHYPESFIVK
jgi:hypothetical protein